MPFKRRPAPTGSLKILVLEMSQLVTAMSNDDDGTQVLKGTSREDVRLENLGYEQGNAYLKMRISIMAID